MYFWPMHVLQKRIHLFNYLETWDTQLECVYFAHLLHNSDFRFGCTLSLRLNAAHCTLTQTPNWHCFEFRHWWTAVKRNFYSDFWEWIIFYNFYVQCDLVSVRVMLKTKNSEPHSFNWQNQHIIRSDIVRPRNHIFILTNYQHRSKVWISHL